MQIYKIKIDLNLQNTHRENALAVWYPVLLK